MAGPYVELLLDLKEAAVVPGSVRYRIDRALVPTSETQVKVACDSTGHVVVYKLRAPGELVVWSKAQWNGDELSGGPPPGTMLEDVQWKMVEPNLQLELDNARENGVDTDQTARADDAAALYVPPPPGGLFTRVWQTIVGVIVVILIIGGVVVWKMGEIWWHKGQLGNGDKCLVDRECASGYCRGATCAPRNVHYSNGSRCEYSEDCASKHCNSRHVCSE